jgi:hypothetical protein
MHVTLRRRQKNARQEVRVLRRFLLRMGATDSKLAFRKSVFRLFEENVRRTVTYCRSALLLSLVTLTITLESTREC